MGGGSPAPAPPPPAPDYSSQLAGLASGQGTIRTDISNMGNTIKDESRDLSKEITTGFNNQTQQFNTVNNSLDDIQGSVDTGFANVGDQLTGLGTDIDNQFDAFGKDMSAGFTGVNNTVNTGFNTLGNQVDTRFGELNNNVNTGFGQVNDNLTTGFTAVGDLINTNDAALMANQQSGFAGVNENVTNVGQNLGDQLTETSTNVLAGQKTIADLVKQYGGNLDTYYAALAAGQSEAAARQAALQTGLDQFRGQYDKDTTLANQQRGRIADAVTGGNAMLQDQLAQTQNASQQGISNLTNQVAGVQSQVQDNAAGATKDFANIAKMITTGFDDGSANTAAMKAEFADRLNTVRNVLTTQSDKIDAQTKQTYSTLVSSFDQQGALIANSVDASGMQIARAIDSQGNLMLASFNQQGQRVDQQALNINQLMRQMDAMGYVPGSNTNMGAMTGQAAQVYSGLASPYSSTR